MRIIVAMFDSRPQAEATIERLSAARCPRDAVTFLPETMLTEISLEGCYDWRLDKSGLWRGLSIFEVMNAADRYTLAEGMHRGASVLLVAAANDAAEERYAAVLSEAGALDIDDLERRWRETGWKGFDGEAGASPARRRTCRVPRLRCY